MPRRKDPDHSIHAMDTFRRLIANVKYREGVIAQVFYVAAQIMCWTFIIQYAENLGLTKAQAQNYNIIAMGIFLSSRFISTMLMKYMNSRLLLTVFAVGGFVLTLGTILIDGMAGLYCLIGVSAFMSLMFPTIYGIALEGLGEDATLGAAGLVMAIVGGALMPPLQGALIDMGTISGIAAVNFSFILPLICFVVIAVYGYRTMKVHG
jgi:FHS family L-fucose permease-like MFS transporter